MDGPSLAALYQGIVDVASNLQIVAYFHVASVALYTYDYLLTLGMELEYIWQGSWNFLKVLYILQRYLPFFDTGTLVLYHHFVSNPSPSRCHYVYLISGWTFLASMAISEIILSFRVWVIWQRSKVLAVALPVFFLACWVPTIFFEDLVLNSIAFGDAPYSPHSGCFITGGKGITYICWIFLLVYESGLLMLILISALRHERDPTLSTSLSGVVYRDGILYYIYLFVLSLANVVIIVLLPGEMGELLSCLERISYSLLTSRVVLHIRRHAQKTVHCADLSTDVAIVKEETLPPFEGAPGPGMLAQELFELDRRARPAKRVAPPPSSFRPPEKTYYDDGQRQHRKSRRSHSGSRRSSWASFLSIRSEDMGIAL